MSRNDICFVGLENLPVLAREYGHLGVGGEQVQQTLLGRAYVQRGYRVATVVTDHGQPDGARWDGITTYRAFRPEAGIPGFRFFHPRWTGIWSAMARADADVYYVSCAGMRVGLAAMFCRRHGRRLVFRTAHDTDCQPENLLLRYERDRRLYAYGIRRADAILTQSVRQRDDLLRNYGLHSTVAGMLVERPKALKGFGERDIDVLWVNNLLEFKRPDLLLDLAVAMPALRFVMIGGPDPADSSLFEAMRERAGSIPNLEFLGRVPYHDVNDYYARSKVFVNTSDSEGFPNSYLQAWARGTPVISFFDPDGKIAAEGLGIAAQDLRGMAEAVTHLVDDETAWRDASRRSADCIAREFDEDRILAPYTEALGLRA